MWLVTEFYKKTSVELGTNSTVPDEIQLVTDWNMCFYSIPIHRSSHKRIAKDNGRGAANYQLDHKRGGHNVCKQLY